jgi:riboflavin kinase / FMN adenylyltransferase
MQIVRGLESVPPDARPSVVALGTFDGVHLGHRAILGTAVTRARAAGLQPLACTFEQHPAEILNPARAPKSITTVGERLELIGETGVDGVVVLSFTPALAAVEPEAFVKDVLLGRLRAQEIVVGFNHRFGRGARGDAGLLQAMAGRLGFQAHVVPPLTVEGVAVSSSEVRTALQRGEVVTAARFLGRPYWIAGAVTRGHGRGRTIGFPTANLAPDRDLLIPKGVYGCFAHVEGVAHPAVVNVGVRPTFSETTLAIEAHLLDFTGDLYNRRMRLDFILHLREELRFPSVDELKAQIARDAAAAREGLRGR